MNISVLGHGFRAIVRVISFGAIVVMIILYSSAPGLYAQEAPEPSDTSDTEERSEGEEAGRDITYPYYSDAVVCASGGGSLTGSDNEARVWNFLTAPLPDGGGFTPPQAAGMMGNMQAEAHFEPRLVEYGWPNSRGEESAPGEPSSLDDVVPPDVGPQGQPGYGIVQWTSPGRKEGLRALQRQRAPTLASDLRLQLDYLMQELNAGYRTSVLDPIRATQDINVASDIFLERFEVPGDIPGQTPIRRENAAAILARYGSGAPAPAPDENPDEEPEDPAPTPPPDDGCGGETTGSGELPTGEPRELAQQILDSRNVTFPAAEEYRAQVQAIADGDNSCQINPKILGVILAASREFTVQVTSINRSCTGATPGAGTRSRHWVEGGGHAVDFDDVNGVEGTGSSAEDVKLLDYLKGMMPPGSRFGQADCRASAGVSLDLPPNVTEFNDDPCTHTHVDVTP